MDSEKERSGRLESNLVLLSLETKESPWKVKAEPWRG